MTFSSLFPTDLVLRVTGATGNQLKYWVKIKLVTPHRNGKRSFYTFRDIVKLKVISSLKINGLSLQVIRKGIDNLNKVLPPGADPLTRLIILTDGQDMIVMDKGIYFSATSIQRFFRFDTEQMLAAVIQIQSDNLLEATSCSRIGSIGL